jgi:hypothetical protein
VPDRTSQLLLNALSRAAAEPAGLPLHPARGNGGLFPATTPGRHAARRSIDEGYLRPSVGPVAVAASTVSAPTAVTTSSAKSSPETFVLTEKGLSFLLGQTSPRPILEDFVRALETRHEQASALLSAARRMLSELSSLRSIAERVLERVREPGYVWTSEAEEPEAATRDWKSLLLAALARRQSVNGPSEDCPLPDLFRLASEVMPALTTGQFHDSLRALNDEGRIYLHPWTGPLYDLPEPAFALLIGHVVAYYASVRP